MACSVAWGGSLTKKHYTSPPHYPKLPVCCRWQEMTAHSPSVTHHSCTWHIIFQVILVFSKSRLSVGLLSTQRMVHFSLGTISKYLMINNFKHNSTTNIIHHIFVIFNYATNLLGLWGFVTPLPVAKRSKAVAFVLKHTEKVATFWFSAKKISTIFFLFTLINKDVDFHL